MAATPNSAGEANGAMYTLYKAGSKVKIGTATKVMSTPLDLATYVVQQWYDGDTGQGQRADLIAGIATAIGLYKGNI